VGQLNILYAKSHIALRSAKLHCKTCNALNDVLLLDNFIQFDLDQLI